MAGIKKSKPIDTQRVKKAKTRVSGAVKDLWEYYIKPITDEMLFNDEVLPFTTRVKLFFTENFTKIRFFRTVDTVNFTGLRWVTPQRKVKVPIQLKSGTILCVRESLSELSYVDVYLPYPYNYTVTLRKYEWRQVYEKTEDMSKGQWRTQ